MSIPVTLRSVKGDTLTFTEMDNNFGGLANANVTITAGGAFSTIMTDGSGFTIANTATITATMTGNTISFATTAAGTGATGAVGYTGSSGTNGATGVVGYTGSVGDTGATGVVGYTGSGGVTGATGAVGYTGSNADLASPGAIGSTTPNTGAFTTISTTGNVSMGGNYLINAVVQNVREKVIDLGTTSGIITIDADAGSIQTVIVSANVTINTNNLTNFTSGETVSVIITQATNTSLRVLTSNILFAGGSKTLSTANAAIDTMHITYDGTRYLGSLVKGYA